MASINWRNDPASSIRVDRPNHPRHTMAACVPPMPQTGTQKDVPFIEKDQPHPPLATSDFKCHSPTEDASMSTLPPATHQEKSSGKGNGSTPKKPTPNAFVSLRVSSPSIHKGLQAVQDGMVAKDKAVRSALTSLDKLHITLSVIRLETEEDQERYGGFL